MLWIDSKKLFKKRSSGIINKEFRIWLPGVRESKMMGLGSGHMVGKAMLLCLGMFVMSIIKG